MKRLYDFCLIGVIILLLFSMFMQTYQKGYRDCEWKYQDAEFKKQKQEIDRYLQEHKKQ